ncbi:myc box-dependent-interacting protein 1b isoform X7 [Antennarius striatus]|uniref:myc box-dependent-interacting protein 1b isoform X7 n=1 Tax=Antennarius striatus TaxID=241820 RepID=UPI0035B1C540
MAETGKGVTAGKLAINVQKRLTRAQEKVLQKLGKADETRDAAFEEMVANFNKQMNEGTKLHKDLKAYLTAVKTMHDASRRLQDCLADMYEPEWFGKEEMDALAEEMIEKEMDNNLEDTDTLWMDYHQNMMDKPLSTMDAYLTQFPDIRARIAKRDRKMVDFDSARHHFASLQKGKKKDEAKIAKPAALLEMAAPSWAQGLISAHQVAQTNLSYNQAEEDLGRAQKIYEELNVELQDELPALWDNRVGVYVNTFQSLAGHQEKFHREMSKLSQNLNDIMTKLEEQRELNDEVNHSESAGSPPKASSWDSWREHTSTDQYGDQDPEETPGGWGYDDSEPQSCTHPGWDDADTAEGQEDWSEGGVYGAHSYPEPSWDDDGAPVGQEGWGDDGGDQAAATSGSEGDVPPGFLYKVKAVHDYAATDSDELELKTGDMVLALAFDTPDEQDDGWLLGVKESHWLQNKDISAKGVFPENFTQKV